MESKLFKGSEYYCKIHSKHSDYIVPSTTYNYKNIKNAKLFTLKQFCINNTIAIEHCKKKCDFLEAIRDFFAERVLSPTSILNIFILSILLYLFIIILNNLYILGSNK